ncbi:MAG: RpiB/LacA/LacB family sugar-phosphate isomerase [Clostridia bacterium]|nr:RpiB/LacA/LacB family sugar-phosphate isomerase [Clostridia bacterium]
MKIAVVQASTQISKNEMLFEYTKKYAKNSEVTNYGCFADDKENYSYLEIALFIGMLIDSRKADFVVTGCSSGQGMMLACNSMPGVLCGYTPTPKDAYLFARINNGNAVSLPLGEEYTYSGKENLEETLKALFSEPFGGGYPKSEAKRKITDSEKLKHIRRESQIDFREFLNMLDEGMVTKVRRLFERRVKLCSK